MGSVTYLDFINSVLKRTRTIQGDAGSLATDTTSTATGYTPTGPFTDGARQNEIDVALQVANETFHEVFSMGLLAAECSTATITLVTNQREYSLPSDFERFAGDSDQTRGMFRGATRQYVFGEYPGGYAQMLVDQPGLASQWQGEPAAYAISPVNLQTIRLDRSPTSNENGWTYNTLYEKRIARTTTQATQTLPFSDTVSDALVPVVAEWWQRGFKKEFDANQFRISIARAVSFMTQTQRRTSYGPPTSYR